jgi:hypothetical protein
MSTFPNPKVLDLSHSPNSAIIERIGDLSTGNQHENQANSARRFDRGVSGSQEVANFLATVPTSEQIAGCWLSAKSEKRVSDLMKAKRTCDLTPAEQAAYEEYTRIEALMLDLKTKVFAKLGQSSQSLS